MFTIELLALDWDDRDNPAVVDRVPAQAARLADAFMIAKALFDDGSHPSVNAFRIKDGGGAVVLRSWERAL